MEIADGGGPFHLRLISHVLSCKSVRLILDADAIARARPADFERHGRWNRRRTAAEQRVDDVVEVEEVNVVRLVHRVAGARVDAANGCRRQPRRPEKTARRDARIEVDDLRPRNGVVDVDSYESERTLTRLAVDTPIQSLHEAHVRRDEWQINLFARGDFGARDGAIDVGESNGSTEVRDARRFRVDRIETAIGRRTVHVKPAA